MPWQRKDMEVCMNRMILGDKMIIPISYGKCSLNNHVAIFGPSGSGKTQSIIMPYLLENLVNDISENLIISDPKGSLYRLFATLYRENGYKVYSIDLNRPEKSMYGFDIMKLIKCEDDIIPIVHAMFCCETFAHESRTDDRFWDDSAELMFSCAFAIAFLEEGSTFSDVLEYCHYFTDRKGLELIGMIIEKIKLEIPDSIAIRMYEKVLAVTAADRTYASIVATLNSHLARYESGEIKRFFQKKHIFEFDNLIKDKAVLFIKFDDLNDAWWGYANLIYDQLIHHLYAVADSNGGKLNIPTRFIYDDFGNCVVQKNYERIISLARARNISFTVALQDLNQLNKSYGESVSKTILNNFDTQLYFSSNSVETNRYLSELADIPLIDVKSMPLEDLWIVRRGSDIVKTKRFDIEKHQLFNELVKSLKKISHQKE